MASVYQKRGSERWYARVKGDKVPGKWSDVACEGCASREEAERYAKAAQKAIDRRRGVARPDVWTLSKYVEHWIERRRESGNDWTKDRGKLNNHVLTAMGSEDIADITPAMVADLVHVLRFRKKLASRTVRNVYSVLAAVMRDARIAGHVSQTPCILTDAQLGPIVDKDPEWRASALFSRKEVETMIGDRRIPLDRQLVYAFGVLAGLRIGEGAALRWRHYDPDRKPLGCLTVALAYSTSHSRAKGTKTNAVRYVPVHPVLADLLAIWRREGWSTMFGADPQPDDLIVPLPPEVSRTRRTGDRYRGWDYTGRRWREVDLPALGWRARSVYDSRATFITLALEDDANPAIIRERVTHAKARRDAFDGYDRGERWAETCREVAKLKIRRFAEVVLREDSTMRKQKLRRRVSNVPSCPPQLTVIQGGRRVIPSQCDLAMAQLSASLRTEGDAATRTAPGAA